MVRLPPGKAGLGPHWTGVGSTSSSGPVQVRQGRVLCVPHFLARYYERKYLTGGFRRTVVSGEEARKNESHMSRKAGEGESLINT
jgi:hypothetical protein